MALRGDISSLKRLKAHLRQLPLSLAHDVARRGAPAMTALTLDAFNAARSVYGEARPRSRSGRVLSLRKTGETARELRFVVQGTVIRCILGPKYARYLVGKYGILPNGALPVAWSRKLSALVSEAAP